MPAYVFGVDVGGTTVKIGLFSSDGALVEKWEIVTRKEQHGAFVLPDIADAVCGKLQSRGISVSDVSGIGIGVPGAVTEYARVARLVNVGWGSVNVSGELKALMAKRVQKDGETLSPDFRVPVVNDANAAALGELWKGAGTGCDSLVMVTLGTGIGGGVIVNKRIVAGANGAAGEIGHLHVCDDEKEPCTCGNYGCLEQYASATGLVRMAKRYLAMTPEGGTPAEGASLLRNLPDPDAKDVIDAAKKGDPVANRAMHTMCRYLGESLAHVSNIINPDVFVIGGGVSKAGTVLTDLIAEYCRPHAFREAGNTPFEIAKLGNDGGICGAAYLVNPA